MGKRKSKLSEKWLHDIWNVRALDYGDGELEDFDQLISSAVAQCLQEENRAEIAATLSYLLGEEISVHMLNAYASEARRTFRIPASRLFALIAVTRRYDLLDAIVREVGGKALDRHDAKVFRIGVDYVANVSSARTLRENLVNYFDPIEP